MIAARQTLHGGKRLPYDAEVEYLGLYEKNFGTYIDTGVSARLMPNMELDCLPWVGNAIVFGARSSVSGSSDGYQLYTDPSGYISVHFCEVSVITKERWGQGNKISVRMNPTAKNATINGNVYALNYSGENQFIDAPIWLWGRNPDGFYANARIYYCKMTLPDGTLVRDLIPVRVGDIGYMYDKVSGKLFGNQGTGDFVLGPDKKPADTTVSAKSYIQDGLVAMWDGIENAGWGKSSNEAILTNLVTAEQFVAPNGVTRGNGFFDVAKGISWNIGDYAYDSSIREHTIESVGCLLTKPTNQYETNGRFYLGSVGMLWMWRKATDDKNSGIIGISSYNGNTAPYVHLKDPLISTLTESQNEVFGIPRHRAAVINRTVSQSYGFMNGGNKRSALGQFYLEAPTSASIIAPMSGGAVTRFHRLAIYNRALTDAEIAHNYAVDKERFGL